MTGTQTNQDKKLIAGVVVVGFVILISSAWAWWRYVYTTPQNVFERMLSTSLSTPSVAKSTVEYSDQQTLDQTTQLSVNPHPSVRTKTTAAQAGSAITTESIAFPDREYFRYTSITTPEQDEPSATKQYQDALNIWGFSSENGLSEGAQLFDQTLLGVVPIGRLNPADKQALLAQIQNESVYTIDYSTVTKETIDGRSVYTYKVGLKPRAYVNMLKSFASFIGTNELADVNVNDYPESPTLNVDISVDIMSGQLVGVTYPDSQRTERFSAHGAYNRVDEPTQYIPLAELQSKLQ